MRFNPHDYQARAIRWIEDRPRCCLFLDMGLGKTVATLTAFARMQADCMVERMLVVAPKKVAETTWSAEAAKWDHLRRLRVSLIAGSAARRLEALRADADVYVVSRDNIAWLCKQMRRPPFDMLVLDELTSFKNHRAQRFKAVKALSPMMARVVGLTGTPSPNGLSDLWAQLYCIDLGERLGKSHNRFMAQYFDVRMVNYIPVKVTPKKHTAGELRRLMGDITLCMQAKDYLKLPPMMVHDTPVELDPDTRRAYGEFERDSVLTLAMEHGGGAKDIPAASAAALMNKLSQMANGAIYDEEGTAHEVHSEKLSALAEIVEAAQSPVLVFYQYRHDIPRIKETLKDYYVRKYEGPEELAAWNAGEIDVLLAHPASTAYGLNMQGGGSVIVWFGTGWNLELYQQANARLHRQGQQKPVLVYRLLAKGTVDERACAALDGKKDVQQALLDSLGALITKYAKQ